METVIMSKTNDTEKTRELTEDRRPLAVTELDTVSRGMLSFGRAATAPQSTDGLMQTLQQLIQQLQGRHHEQYQ
jgi:hypothetical protein